MKIRRHTSNARGVVPFWALAGIALLASHDAIFLVQIGPGEELAHALRSAGHGYWGIASVVLAIVGALAAFAVAVRLRRLRLRARRLGAEPAAHRSYTGRVVLVWARLFAVVAIGFLVQENLEHLGMHSHGIGLGALLGPEYPLALPVISLITLGAALVAALLAGSERALLETIAAALRRLAARAPRDLIRAPLQLTGPRISALARAAAGRAPPRMLVSTT